MSRLYWWNMSPAIHWAMDTLELGLADMSQKFLPYVAIILADVH